MIRKPRTPKATIAAVKPPPSPYFTTETLEAIEWDLRSRFDFGDLRPFEFCIGAQIVRFPDRTDLDNPKVNAGPHFLPTNDFPARTDAYVVMAHVFPPGFEAGREMKRRPRKTARSAEAAEPEETAQAKPVRKKKPKLPPLPEPVKKEGKIDWAYFIAPAPSGLFPYNTVLPETWQYGDPIPGARVE